MFSGARFSKAPRLFGWHNSLCIFKTKVFRVTKLWSYFNFYSLYNIWNDQLYRIGGSEFHEFALRARKVFGSFEKRAPGQIIVYCNCRQLLKKQNKRVKRLGPLYAILQWDLLSHDSAATFQSPKLFISEVLYSISLCSVATFIKRPRPPFWCCKFSICLFYLC